MNSIQNKLIEISNKDSFLEEVYQLYLNNSDDRSAIGQELATLHNQGIINIVAKFQNLKKSSQGHNFFYTRYIFEDALPALNAPVLEIMDCVKHLTIEAGNDLAAGTTVSSFITYCEANNTRPHEVLTHAFTDIEESFDFIAPALIAGSKANLQEFVNKAIELTSHENIDVCTKATFALGRINYLENTPLIHSALEALNSMVHTKYSDNLFATTLKSIFLLYTLDKKNEIEVVELIKFVLNYKESIILHNASDIFAFNNSDIPKSMLDLFLEALVEVKPENTGTLQNIDLGLNHLLEINMEDKAFIFIDKLLTLNKGVISISLFKSFTHTIQKNKHQLNKLITRWLLAKSVLFGHATSDLIGNYSDKGTKLKADLTQLEHRQKDIHLFLARKACAWFFLHPVSAVSFIISLVDSASEDEVESIQEIIFNPLLISYSGSVKDYLNEIDKESSEKVQTTIGHLLKELDSYHDGLRSAKEITELSPTISQREAYQRKWNRLMSDSFKEAPKGFLSEIFGKPSILLYGNSSIHYIHYGANDNKNRQVMPMHSISHSIEFPALEFLDPHGLDYMLRIFKLEGCKS